MTATTDRPARRRGIVRLDENVLNELIRLPAGQRIVAFRTDSFRLCIDVAIEGDGLPEAVEGAELPIVNTEEYLSEHGRRWAARGTQLAEMVAVLVDKYGPADNALADLLRVTLAGQHDPRVQVEAAK